MSFATPRLYVALLIMCGSLMLLSLLDTPKTHAAEPDWSSLITPLKRRPDAEIPSLKLNYEISWSQWLQAGRFDLAFEPKESARADLVEISAQTRSLGPASMFWPYESSTRAEIRRRTLYPVRFEHVQTKSGERETYRATYRHGVMQVESRRASHDGRAEKHKTRTYEHAQIRDVLSTLLFLQQFDLSRHRQITLLVQPLDRLYLVSFSVVGQESRQVFDKTWKTLRLSVHVRRVTDDFTLTAYDKLSHATLWLSDDAYRIPVEIQADLRLGFASMRLRSLD